MAEDSYPVMTFTSKLHFYIAGVKTGGHLRIKKGLPALRDKLQHAFGAGQIVLRSQVVMKHPVLVAEVIALQQLVHEGLGDLEHQDPSLARKS